MNIAPRIHVSNNAQAEIIDSIDTGLRTYNRQSNAEFWAKATDPAHAEQPLVVHAIDSEGTFLGGLVGETFLKWLKIERMSVVELHRRQGIGSGLLAAAEREAIERGCHYAFLDTMQYQAPAFYEKLGYSQAAMIPDWDSHGHAKYFFVKTLQ